ncbi:MAG: hypothetical protein IT208_12790 [Chthonomonadales bacterium]|nr:hypothetical protein [Chthonomonadales bacterium]
MRRWLLPGLAATLALGLALPAAAAAGRRGEPGSERVSDRGRIDWEKGVLYATGLGAVSQKEPNAAKAYLRARTFAKLDALRNLLMVVDHVRIDAKTTGRDFTEASDEIRAEVKGILRGAQVVAERQVRMGGGAMVEVTVATPLYGDRGIARVFVPELARRERAATQAPAPPIVTTPPSAPEVLESPLPRSGGSDALQRDRVPAPRLREPTGGVAYTALIVDARGLGVERCMSPKIRRPDGSEVWGTLDVNLSWLIENGIVVYARSIERARHNARTGQVPLVVRAIGRAGGAYRSDVVVSDADADRILAANRAGGFLDAFRVVFVVDANR